MTRPPAAAAGRPVLAGAVANLAVGTLFAWSLVAREAAAAVGTTPRVAGAVFATAVAVFAGVLLWVGRALRRWGTRPLLRAAAVLGGGGLLLAATGGGPLALWAGVALLFGTANGLAYGVAAALAARVPARRRGAATGAVVAAYAAGPVALGAVAPPALRTAGWQVCLAVLGAVVAGLLLVAAQLAPPDGAPGRPRAGRGALRRVRRPVVLLWLVFAGGTAPALAVFAYAVPLAAGRGLDAAAAGLALSALAAGNLAGRVAGGTWSDRTGRPVALATALGAGAASLGCLAGPAAPGLVVAGFLGTGLAYGAVSSLVPAATADAVGPDAFPTAYGWVFTGWGAAGLLAPVAGGSLLGAGRDATWLLLLLGVAFVPAACALWALRGGGDRGRP
ncbi:MFS transporter [Geodermatophilus sp. YIM 151500]|uniref:MFS transporter n=1 Tax=Geodermatophilus sp. YIM 151500 TaxID=2984531 RepID=UPI0021E4637B|nr:MFS transporter [Geodermatophilus sp. YIM 151500]MCV2489328.1 MFS transporter [Geodermatophilus sp. YIM 151500]